MSKPVEPLRRSEILHYAYNFTENPSEDIDLTQLSTSRIAAAVFLGQLKRAEVPAYLSRFGEFTNELDKESRDHLHVLTVNGLHGPVCYDDVVDLVIFMTEMWNKVYKND